MKVSPFISKSLRTGVSQWDFHFHPAVKIKMGFTQAGECSWWMNEWKQSSGRVSNDIYVGDSLWLLLKREGLDLCAWVLLALQIDKWVHIYPSTHVYLLLVLSEQASETVFFHGYCPCHRSRNLYGRSLQLAQDHARWAAVLTYPRFTPAFLGRYFSLLLGSHIFPLMIFFTKLVLWIELYPPKKTLKS